MESWIKNQCHFHSYRAHSIKLSLKSLFTLGKAPKNDLDPFLNQEDSIRNSVLIEKEIKKCDHNAKEEKVWRRLSLNSFRRRREKKQEDRSKPVLPAVLRTYDKQTKEQREWL